jgi:cyanobactin maturation PatA/PatG family protease
MSSVETFAEPQAATRDQQGSDTMQVAAASVLAAPGVEAASCGCAECAAKAQRAANTPAAPQLVFALGQLGHDLVSEARRDSIAQHMTGGDKNPADARALLEFLKHSPWEATAILWTLNLDQTPIYAISPSGPYAEHVFEELRKAYLAQVERKVERVSIPGRLVGQARLYSGQVVPVIQPEPRGFYAWNTAELLKAVCGAPPAAASAQSAYQEKVDGVREFFDRVYHELRNLGVTPQDRAVNYAATNAFLIQEVYERSMKEEMDLDEVHVERSPICRPESDCWDVVLAFFYPGRPQPAVRKHYRFTVDVSDVVPVMVGEIRAWFKR